MIVKCEKCQTAYDIDDTLLKPSGTKMRCSRCQHVFRIYPPSKSEPAEPAKTKESPPPTLTDNAPVVRRFENTGPRPSLPGEAPPAPSETVEPVTEDARRKGPEQETAAEKASQKRAGSRYIPFRYQLLRFALLLIAVIGVIVIPIEAYRPIQELHGLINSAKAFISGLQANMNTEDIGRMNRFALETIRADNLQDIEEEERSYYFMAFNLLISRAELPEESEILKEVEDFSMVGGRERFDYGKLRDAYAYWIKRFRAEEGLYGIYRRYKRLLRDAVENAESAGLGEISIQIMLDTGEKEGVFENNIAFIVDGAEWYEGSYSGELYEIENNEFWREGALTGTPGFGNNPIHDPRKFYLPRFDADEYGRWFSVWRTVDSGENYNIINMDFDASDVILLLFTVVAVVLAAIVVLGVIAFMIASKVSTSVTRPITELTKGAERVAKGDYDYVVPVIREDEIGHFTHQFNAMTQGQKERLNLMETLEKFLSRELAEKAAASGLVLGGQTAMCTVMFTDFGGFSTITRKMTAADAVTALNTYFDGLIPIVKKYGGFPDKYIGDAIVAMFGAPVPLEDHAERAVACAIEMQWKMREINDERRRNGEVVFEMRIGLNSGDVIVGAIGCDQKLEYTSIGETTNLANRMESQCDIGHIMIAEGTFDLIRGIFFKGVHISPHPEQVQVKGYPQPVSAYRIYVDNREMKKNMNATDIRNFYIYNEVDHKIKFSPQEVGGTAFKRRAKYIES